MKRLYFFLGLFGIWGQSCLFCSTFTDGNITLKNGDFGIWNYDIITGAINDKLSLYGETTFRYEDNASFFYYFHEHLQLDWKICRFFSIAPAYRQMFVRADPLFFIPNAQEWIPVYYPNFSFSEFWDSKFFHFKNRTLIAYEIVGGPLPNAWVYRDKFMITTLNQYTFLKLQLGIDGEIFIRQRQGIIEYRLSSQLSINAIPKLTFGLGYRFVSLKTPLGPWFNRNVLLINLIGSF